MRKLIVCLLLLPSLSWAATPTISNVTGTITTGQTITITGTHMIDQAAGNWSESVGSFEGASYTADGWSDDGNTPAYDTNVKLLGSQSLRSTITGTSTSGCPDNNVRGGAVLRAGTGSWVRFYVRYSDSFGSSLWSQIGSAGGYVKLVEYVSPTQVYLQPSAFSGGGPTEFWMQITGGTEGNSHLANQMTSGKWYCVEYHLESTGLTMYVDGQLVQVYTSGGTLIGNTLAGTVNTSVSWPAFGIINACPVNGSGSAYIDGLMSNSSRVYPASAIEVSGDNGATWRYQPPASLSDTSSTVTADLPTLTADSYLLRVTNNLQETSSTYNLSGGGAQSGSLAPGVSAAGVTFR